jgi:8-amino-7-oxononanoate synthase
MMTERSQLDFVRDELVRIESLHQRRSLKRLETSNARTVVFEGKELVNFSSNDYLGLSQDERVKKAAQDAIDRYHASSASSRLICGNMSLHEQLEEELADFKGREAALVFSSGYMANLGLLSALAGEGDLICSDELNHASIIDGCRLSKAKTLVFRHKELNHLESMLKHPATSGRKLIVSDSVFSMDGDLSDVAGLMELAEKYDALLMLDEAHATGILGRGGRGAIEHFEDLARIKKSMHWVDVEMGTLSKALGSFGGFVACDRSMRDFLINKSRPFIFSTALPPASVGAARASLAIVRQESAIRKRLWENTRMLKEQLHEREFETGPSQTPIVPVCFGSEARALEVSAGLMKRGFFVPAIRPPTVPKGTSRLRLTVSAAHSEAEIGALVHALAEVDSGGKRFNHGT